MSPVGNSMPSEQFTAPSWMKATLPLSSLLIPYFMGATFRECKRKMYRLENSIT